MMNPEDVRTETEISGARFHRAGHVINVPHVQKTTVISAPVLTVKNMRRSVSIHVANPWIIFQLESAQTLAAPAVDEPPSPAPMLTVHVRRHDQRTEKRNDPARSVQCDLSPKRRFRHY